MVNHMNTYAILSQSLYDQLMAKTIGVRSVREVVFAKIVLPINKIDGIHNIQCVIKLNTLNFKDFQLELLIDTRGELIFTKRTGFFRGTRAFPLKGRMPARIKEFQDTIKKLRVSPKGDKLTADYEMEKVIWAANIEFCSGLGETVGKSYDECCVCTDNTVFTTFCKHHVCIRCISRLVKPECPMCRGEIYDEDEDEYDDDDDDDDEDDDNDEVDDASSDNDNAAADDVSEADPCELVSDLDALLPLPPLALSAASTHTSGEPASDRRMGACDFTYISDGPFGDD